MTVVGHCLPRMTWEDMSLLALDDMARHVSTVGSDPSVLGHPQLCQVS
jgi:hypothetical protein